jgi:hypothetical protein
MADDNFITGSDPDIAAAMAEIMPIIDQRLARAAGSGRRVSFLLFAGVEGEGRVSVAVNKDDPRDVVTAVMTWARFVEERNDNFMNDPRVLRIANWLTDRGFTFSRKAGGEWHVWSDDTSADRTFASLDKIERFYEIPPA